MTNGTYAEGVTFHSPGFAATPRTPGYAVHGDCGYPNGVGQSPDVHGDIRVARTIGTRHPAFVKPRWGLDSARPGLPRVRRCAATLGFGM